MVPYGQVSPQWVLEENGATLVKPDKPEIVAPLQVLDEMVHQGQRYNDSVCNYSLIDRAVPCRRDL